jgi:hypothetical protein
VRSEELQKVGVFAMEAIENIAKHHHPDAEVDEMMLVVAIRQPDEEGLPSTGVRYECSDVRGYVQRGLVEEAMDAVRFGTRDDDE